MERLGPLSTISKPEPQIWRTLASAATEYDDICARILSLEGVKDENALCSLGHRLEVSLCRIAAARALQATGCSARALERSTQAIMAASVEKTEHPAAFQESALTELQKARIDALLLRSSAQLSCGDFASAHRDALEAHTSCSRCTRGLSLKELKERQKDALEVALRCEVALHGGGPGEDGHGVPMSVEEACSFRFSSTDGVMSPTHELQGHIQDLQSMDWCIRKNKRSASSETKAQFHYISREMWEHSWGMVNCVYFPCTTLQSPVCYSNTILFRVFTVPVLLIYFHFFVPRRRPCYRPHHALQFLIRSWLRNLECWLSDSSKSSTVDFPWELQTGSTLNINETWALLALLTFDAPTPRGSKIHKVKMKAPPEHTAKRNHVWSCWHRPSRTSWGIVGLWYMFESHSSI